MIALHIAARAPKHIRDLRLVSASLKEKLRPLWTAVSLLGIRRVLSHVLIAYYCPWTMVDWYTSDSWAASGLLPSSGCHTWTVTVLPTATHRVMQPCLGTPDFDPLIYVGVSNAASTCAWALSVYDGRLRRWSRDADGNVRGAPTPAGYPNGHLRVVTYPCGSSCGVGGELISRGARVDVLLDVEAGTLAFRLNNGPLVQALHGFPTGANHRLRPWCRGTCTQLKYTACDRSLQ